MYQRIAPVGYQVSPDGTLQHQKQFSHFAPPGWKYTDSAQMVRETTTGPAEQVNLGDRQVWNPLSWWPHDHKIENQSALDRLQEMLAQATTTENIETQAYQTFADRIETEIQQAESRRNYSIPDDLEVEFDQLRPDLKMIPIGAGAVTPTSGANLRSKPCTDSDQCAILGSYIQGTTGQVMMCLDFPNGRKPRWYQVEIDDTRGWMREDVFQPDTPLPTGNCTPPPDLTFELTGLNDIVCDPQAKACATTDGYSTDTFKPLPQSQEQRLRTGKDMTKSQSGQLIFPLDTGPEGGTLSTAQFPKWLYLAIAGIAAGAYYLGGQEVGKGK